VPTNENAGENDRPQHLRQHSKSNKPQKESVGDLVSMLVSSRQLTERLLAKEPEFESFSTQKLALALACIKDALDEVGKLEAANGE
jgi:hypothetical protein